MNENILFLNSETPCQFEYKKMMQEIYEQICDAFSNASAYDGATPDQLKEIIHRDSILPEKGLGWENTLALLREKILPNMLRVSSPHYMPHLHSPALLESVASEAVISSFNQSMDSWDQAPVATEIETEVIHHLCALYGLGSEADGVFTSGGSQSNQTAILLARDWFCHEKLKHNINRDGLPSAFSALRIYTSEISHFSVEKSAYIMGLGTRAVVKVPCDKNKRIDVNALEHLVKADIERGNIPFLTVATVGTTDFGSIDSIEKINEICKKYGMWLHADAAYGSGVVMSEKYKSKVASLSLCDSITVDFHKMFLQAISCSAVLIKDGRNFDTLTIRADYLNRKEDEEEGYTNLVDKSLQTTRRFDALKVWVSFLMRGKDGWSEIITTVMDNALYFYNKIKSNENFSVVMKPEISSVVFRCVRFSDEEKNDILNKSVRKHLLHKKGISVGQTVSDGRVCLKITLLNPLVTHKNLDDLIDEIVACAGERCISFPPFTS